MGEELAIQAKNAMTAKISFTDRYEVVGNLYEEAARSFAQAGMRSEAAINYAKAAKAFKESKYCKDAAVVNYVNAAEHYTDVNYTSAILALNEVIDYYEVKGLSAAKYHERVAELFEAHGNEFKAVKHYEKAGNFFKAALCLLSIGETEKAYAFVVNYNDFPQRVDILLLIEYVRELQVDAFENAVVANAFATTDKLTIQKIRNHLNLNLKFIIHKNGGSAERIQG